MAAAYFLLVLLGWHFAGGAAATEKAIWLSIAAGSGGTLLFDRSPFRWISFLVLSLFALMNIGYEMMDQYKYWLWSTVASLSATVIFSLFGVSVRRWVAFLIIILISIFMVAPVIVWSSEIDVMIKADILVGAAVLMAVFPLFISYFDHYKPETTFRLLSFQQYVLRLISVFFISFFKESGVSLDLYGRYGTVLTWVLVLMLCLVNIKAQRVQWKYGSMTTLSLLFLYASIAAAPASNILLIVICTLMAIAQLTALEGTNTSIVLKITESLAEFSLGSPSNILVLALLFSITELVVSAELAIWSVALFFVLSKQWTQALHTQPWARESLRVPFLQIGFRAALVTVMYAVAIWSVI